MNTITATNTAKTAIEPARGILNAQAGAAKFQLARYLPDNERLRAFVEHYWTVRWDLRGQEPYVQETLPYPSVHLVFERGKTHVVGLMTGKFTRLLEDEGQVVAVKFRPGGFYPFVRVPVSSFTNCTASLEETFGVDGVALEETIFSCTDEAAMIAHLESFLRERLPAPDEKLALIQQIVACISAHPEITSVADVVTRFDLNQRTLQRLFRQYVGVGPKWVIQRYRLHEVAERLATGEQLDWRHIVWELGYTDQAHFIKDFHSIVGQTPTQYVRMLAKTP